MKLNVIPEGLYVYIHIGERFIRAPRYIEVVKKCAHVISEKQAITDGRDIQILTNIAISDKYYEVNHLLKKYTSTKITEDVYRIKLFNALSMLYKYLCDKQYTIELNFEFPTNTKKYSLLVRHKHNIFRYSIGRYPYPTKLISVYRFTGEGKDLSTHPENYMFINEVIRRSGREDYDPDYMEVEDSIKVKNAKVVRSDAVYILGKEYNFLIYGVLKEMEQDGK